VRVDVERLSGLPSAVLVGLALALASLVVFAQLPQHPHVLKVIEKLGHPGVFALVALVTLVLLRKHAAGGAAWVHYLTAFLVCIAIGGATEIAQMFTHRHPALADVGLDARGALGALALAAAFDRRVWLARPRLIRLLCSALACLLAIVVMLPLGRALAAYGNRARNFPLLFVPSRPLDLYFLEHDRDLPELAPGLGPDAPPRALRVPLVARPYAGVTLAEPSPDWRGYAALLVDVTNPGPAALEFNVRIDDVEQSLRYEDRYNGEFPVPPGERRRISIPLATIEAAPRNRRMDMAHIAAVVLFRTGDDGPAAFYLNGVALTK
jgi:VanZ family protein